MGVTFLFSLNSAFSSPKEDSDFTPVEEDKAVRLMRNIASESSANDTMPGRLIHNIKFSFNNLRNVIKYSFLCKCIFRTINSMLLHSFGHICVFNYSYFCVLLGSFFYQL